MIVHQPQPVYVLLTRIGIMKTCHTTLFRTQGKHVIHAYTPATEPYDWWQGLDRRSDEYRKKKEEAADFLW